MLSIRIQLELVNIALEGSKESRQRRHLDVLTARCYSRVMDEAKRATIHFEAWVDRALRLRAAAGNRSTSDMVNEAVRIALAEDADDLSDADQRQDEPSSGFDEFVTSLRNSGQL